MIGRPPWTLASAALAVLGASLFWHAQPRLGPSWVPWLALAVACAVGVLPLVASRRLPLHWRVGLAAGAPHLGAGRWPGRVLGVMGVMSWMVVVAGGQSAQLLWRAQTRLAERLPAALEGLPLWLEGRISGLPQMGPEGLRLEVAVLGLAREDGQPLTTTLPGQPLALQRVVLNWPAGGPGAPMPRVQPGERWRWPVRLAQPHGLMNPGGHDSELWWFERGLGASASVRSGAPTDPQRLAGPRPWHPVDQLDGVRQRWRDAVLVSVPDPAAAGLLAALTVGDQAAIDGQRWALYRDTGIAHLVSISGLHITLFAWLARRVVGRLWRLSPGLLRHAPAPSAGRWAGVLLAALYAWLTGWGVPAQRTVLMLGGVAVLQQTGQRWPGWLVCGVVAAVVTVLDPWAILQPGFWLSFVAVALLMVSGPVQGVDAAPADPLDVPSGRCHRAWAAMREGLRTQWVASVGLAPLSLLCFNQVSLAGMLVNLVAVPLVTFLITPLALLGLLWAPCWQLAAALIAPLHQGLAWAAQWPLANAYVPTLAPLAMGCVLLGGLLLALPGPLGWRAWGLWLCLPALWPPVQRPAPGQFELIALDVGQGSAVLVRTAGHTLLMDAGPAWPGGGDAGARQVLPLLRHLGERQIDRLVISHQDLDHLGGVASVAAAVPVASLLASLPPAHRLWAVAPPGARQWCRAGQAWDWDGVRFQVLHPLAPMPEGDRYSNTASCVLKVQAADGRSALLTGDIEAAQEQALVAAARQHADPDWLRAEVLVVPHHGSRSSSSAEFLAAVAPQVAVIQVAYRSRFGHPHPEVVRRYQQMGIKLVRTDHCGAWVWQGGWACTREVHRRYWQGVWPNPPPPLPQAP